MRIAGKELNLAEDVFKLQHLLDCHLLKHREVSTQSSCPLERIVKLRSMCQPCGLHPAAPCLAAHPHLALLLQDVEELCGSAVKEEQIETKLASIAADWAEQNLNFADYKTRGPVILKVSTICKAAVVHSATTSLSSLARQTSIGASLPVHWMHICNSQFAGGSSNLWELSLMTAGLRHC